MKIINTQQEIILVTGTDFTSRQYSNKDLLDRTTNLSEREQLQEACWNGFVLQKLPEIFISPEDRSKMYLWQLREANHFLGLEMGEYPTEIDFYLSIDPYSFMPSRCEN